MNRQFPGRDLHPLVICAFVANQYIVFDHFGIDCELGKLIYNSDRIKKSGLAEQTYNCREL